MPPPPTPCPLRSAVDGQGWRCELRACSSPVHPSWAGQHGPRSRDDAQLMGWGGYPTAVGQAAMGTKAFLAQGTRDVKILVHSGQFQEASSFVGAEGEGT